MKVLYQKSFKGKIFSTRKMNERDARKFQRSQVKKVKSAIYCALIPCKN